MLSGIRFIVYGSAVSSIFRTKFNCQNVGNARCEKEKPILWAHSFFECPGEMNMMHFEPVTMSMKPQIDAITKEWGEGSCQHSFVTFFALQEKYGDSVCLENGTLYISRDHLSDGRIRTCLMPMGPADTKETVSRLLEDTHERGLKLRLFPITKKSAKAIKEAFPNSFRIYPERRWAEYLYYSRKLVELEGSALAGKRRSIRLFYRDLPGKAEVFPLVPEMIKDIDEFHARWLIENQATHDADVLERELRSERRILSHMEELGITGFVVTVGGMIRGYCFGSTLSPDVYDAIIMKGDRGIRHLYAFMYQELGRLGSRCTYINFEEDLGVPGLRECKLSYHPDRMLYKYCVEEL